MKKKNYMQPTIQVVKIQHQNHLLTVSNTSTTGLDGNMNYDQNGGDQGNAW